MRIYVKKHSVGNELIIAACDENILGLRLVDEERKANFYVDPFFYKGELVDPEEAVNTLSSATMGNIVGEVIVKLAIERGLVHPEAVLWIKGVPIAMFVRV
ncbi:DUF424 domain-containing protein [Desulfurococcus mucosus]|uniref:DUF424 domain-containing protein n=1 Tax=Desulfurococcus mucosus (strain ATCC 35584 / DSM 2162 / JCM 9187 / O7/1) TaxID=765177 RepID=E8RA95_DESM0|nr:DUF424 family protein [Desulfurococcus mucosus]ADV65401.1 protein of unknown function DUF424 [Desulfurococcus mucosus DSM 2162]